MGEVIEFRDKRLTKFIAPDVDKIAGGFPDPLSIASAIVVAYSTMWVAFATATASTWLAKRR